MCSMAARRGGSARRSAARLPAARFGSALGSARRIAGTRAGISAWRLARLGARLRRRLAARLGTLAARLGARLARLGSGSATRAIGRRLGSALGGSARLPAWLGWSDRALGARLAVGLGWHASGSARRLGGSARARLGLGSARRRQTTTAEPSTSDSAVAARALSAVEGSNPCRVKRGSVPLPVGYRLLPLATVLPCQTHNYGRSIRRAVEGHAANAIPIGKVIRHGNGEGVVAGDTVTAADSADGVRDHRIMSPRLSRTWIT
jgi:hypothetical protein